MKPQLLDELSPCLPIAAACSSRTQRVLSDKNLALRAVDF